MTEKNYYFPRTHYSDSSPTVNDDETKGFLQGTLFIKNDVQPPIRFVCIESTPTSAVWFRVPDYIDPNDNTTANLQVDVENADIGRNILLTPQIMFSDNLIEYDITINRNALSAGPITVDTGYTVTVGPDGTWVVV